MNRLYLGLLVPHLLGRFKRWLLRILLQAPGSELLVLAVVQSSEEDTSINARLVRTEAPACKGTQLEIASWILQGERGKMISLRRLPLKALTPAICSAFLGQVIHELTPLAQLHLPAPMRNNNSATGVSSACIVTALSWPAPVHTSARHHHAKLLHVESTAVPKGLLQDQGHLRKALFGDRFHLLILLLQLDSMGVQIGHPDCTSHAQVQITRAAGEPFHFC